MTSEDKCTKEKAPSEGGVINKFSKEFWKSGYLKANL